MNKINEYNLIDEPWIPVLMKSGETRAVSLGEIFADARGDIADLALNPYERISVFRLLLCIAQADMGRDRLQNERSWLAAKDDIGPVAKEYLEKWKDRFFLYGPRAFMQVDCLIPGGTIPDTSRLIVHSAHHFGSPLFSHDIPTNGDAPLDPPTLAVALLTYLNYSASGGSPTCIWNGAPTRQVGAAASPCRSQSKLFTIVMGESLLQTVWMNLLTANQLAELKMELGRPCWEFTFDDCKNVELEASQWLGSVDQKTRRVDQPTLLGLLAPLSRFIKLERETTSCLICEGFGYPSCRDPLATYYKKSLKDGAQVCCLRVDKRRMPWRDLSSILELGTQIGGAMALVHLATLATKQTSNAPFSIWTGGLYSDTDQDKDMASGEWLFTRPLSILRKESLSKYQEAVGWADQQSSLLYKACKRYALIVKTPDPNKPIKKNKENELVIPFSDPAERFFWDILASSDNQRFIRFVQDDESPTYKEDWRRATRKAAEEAYRRACPAMTARQMEAFAQGFSELFVREEGANG